MEFVHLFAILMSYTDFICCMSYIVIYNLRWYILPDNLSCNYIP